MLCAGVGNIARAEAALFALMFGKNLAEPASPFEQDTKKAAPSSSSRSRHASYDKDGGIVHLARKCPWLRAKESSVSAPLCVPGLRVFLATGFPTCRRKCLVVA